MRMVRAIHGFMDNNELVAKFEAARAAVMVEGLSERTMAKRWKVYFAAEDALKAVSSWK